MIIITVMSHNRAAADTGRILAALCSHSTAANSDVSAGLRTGIFPCLLIAAATMAAEAHQYQNNPRRTDIPDGTFQCQP